MPLHHPAAAGRIEREQRQAEQQAEAVRLAKLYVSCGVRGPLWEREYPGGFNSGKGANNGKGVWYIEDDDHLVMQTMHVAQ